MQLAYQQEADDMESLEHSVCAINAQNRTILLTHPYPEAPYSPGSPRTKHGWIQQYVRASHVPRLSPHKASLNTRVRQS